MPARRLEGVWADDQGHDLLQYFVMCGVWALSTYDACDLRCSYCVSYAQGPSSPRWSAREVPARLAAEASVLPDDAAIGVGSIIDCYPSAEATHGATRAALAWLVDAGRRVQVVTKGTTVRRDVDLLAGNDRASVKVSLPTLDEEALHRIEPHAPSAAERLALVRDLADAGVAVQLHVQPWIPGVTDAEAMIDAAAGEVPVCFGPLNVQGAHVAGSGPLGRMDQGEINRAYVAEQQRIGRRPGVTWQRPAWLGAEALDALGAAPPDGWDLRADRLPPRPDAPAGAAERNEATVRRIVEAVGRGVAPLIVLESTSPHIRGHEVGHPDPSGRWSNLLVDAALALEGRTASVEQLTASEDVVRCTVAVEGRHVGELRGASPTGAPSRAVLRLTHRFDARGMVVEVWQELVSLEPQAVPVAAPLATAT